MQFEFSTIACAVMAVVLSACGATAPNQPATGRNDISPATGAVGTPIDIDPETAAEAFALNSKSTDLQRDDLTKRLVGSIVEWDIPVYEIAMKDSVYQITSQPFQVEAKEAIPLLRAIISITSPTERDTITLRTARTDDVLRVRGTIQSTVLRTAIVISPATLVTPSSRTDEGHNASLVVTGGRQ